MLLANGCRTSPDRGGRPRSSDLLARAYRACDPSRRTTASSVLEFVADVRPLYVETNLAIVPDAGLGRHQSESAGGDGHGSRRGIHVLRLRRTWGWNTESTSGSPIRRRISRKASRLCSRIAIPARAHRRRRPRPRGTAISIGEQSAHGSARCFGSCCRRAFKSGPPEPADLAQITAIQATAPEASQWQAPDYLAFDCQVATLDGQIAGFVVSRPVGDQEREILNVAVRPDLRRLGSPPSCCGPRWRAGRARISWKSASPTPRPGSFMSG